MYWFSMFLFQTLPLISCSPHFYNFPWNKHLCSPLGWSLSHLNLSSHPYRSLCIIFPFLTLSYHSLPYCTPSIILSLPTLNHAIILSVNYHNLYQSWRLATTLFCHTLPCHVPILTCPAWPGLAQPAQARPCLCPCPCPCPALPCPALPFYTFWLLWKIYS